MYNLELRNVRKVYGNGHEALRDFNLAVDKGEFIAFLGPSGCGKSTVLRMIAGFETISGGEILINGQRINEMPPADRPTAMIFQNYALFPHLTVRQNVAYGLEVRHLPRDKRDDKVNRMLDVLDLRAVADRRCSALSGGQRQRVAIARALVIEPEVLLLDEPLGALDANLRKAIQNELKMLQKSLGITFIFVTHAQSEALALSDRIVVMNRGRIEQTSAPYDIYTKPQSEFVARFIGRNTLFPGCARRGENGGWTIDMEGRTLGGIPAEQVGEGQAAMLVVPGEAFDILPAGIAAPSDPARNSLPGRIVSVETIGALVRIRAETQGGQQILLESHAGKYAGGLLDRGNVVSLAWAARESTIVASA